MSRLLCIFLCGWILLRRVTQGELTHKQESTQIDKKGTILQKLYKIKLSKHQKVPAFNLYTQKQS